MGLFDIFRPASTTHYEDVARDAVEPLSDRRAKRELERERKIRALINDYQNLANQFSQNLEGRIRKSQGLAVSNIKDQLSQNIQNIRTGANQRGMLFSGIRAGQEATANRQAGNVAAQASADIREAGKAQERQYQNTASNMKFDLDKARNAVNSFDANMAWQEAMDRINSRTQAMSSIGYGAGLAASQKFGQDGGGGKEGYFSASAVQSPKGSNIGFLGGNYNYGGGY